MASKSLNKVMLIGNLTRDPELKYTPSSTAVCSFSIATNRQWTSEGQTKEDVQYHRIVAWQKLAELAAKLLTKGKKIYVEGRLSSRKFVGKDNIEREVTEIVIDDFIIMSPLVQGESHNSYEAPEGDEFVEEAAPKVPKKASAAKEEKEVINDDDIPF